MQPKPKLPLSQRPRPSARPLQNVTSCLVRYSVEKRPVINEKMFLQEKRHALHLPISERYSNRREDHLYSFTNGHDILTKCIVRNFAAKRVRAAWRQTLAESGYAQNGTRRDRHGPGVFGTLELFATSAAIDMKYTDLKSEMLPVLDFVRQKIAATKKRAAAATT